MSQEHGGCHGRAWQHALDGELTPAGGAHIEECDDCAQRLRTIEWAAAATLAEIPCVPEDLEHRVLDAARHELDERADGSSRWRFARATPAGSRSDRRPRSTARPRLAMLCAGLALGVIATASLVGGGTGSVVKPQPAVASDHFLPYCPAPTPAGTGVKPGGRTYEGQEIVVAGVWQNTEAARFRQTLRRFEHATGARVRYVFTRRDIAETIEGRLLRGCPPDIALLPQPGVLTKLARRGALAPIDGFAGDLLRANYSAAWRRMARVGGKSYGIWFKAANKSNLWYSRSALRRAGVAPPATWTQTQRAVQRLAQIGAAAPFAIAGEDGWTLTDWFENVYLRVAGPKRYAQLAAGDIRWTHPTVKRALRTLAELFSMPVWFSGGLIGALTTSFTESVHAVFGPDATAAMTSEGDFVLNEVSARELNDVGVVPFPSINGSSPSVVVGGDIAVLFAKSARDPAARALLRYLATPEAATPWVRAGGFISPNKSVDQRSYANLTTRGLANKLITAPIVRFDLSDMLPPAFGARDSQGMWKILQEYLQDPADIDGVTAKLQKAAASAAACEADNSGEC